MGEKSVKENLEYYLSQENLNKDLYIRKLLDNNGYILVDEILKFNNMVKRGANLETIKEIVEDSEVLELLDENNKTYIRNKNFENF